MSIEYIALENSITLPNSGIKLSTKSCLCHAVFRYFLSGYIKQDSATTNSHSKCLVELLKERKLCMSSLSTLWRNAGGCFEQYICVSQI